MKGDKNVSREEAQGLAARSEIRRQALMKKGLRPITIAIAITIAKFGDKP